MLNGNMQAHSVNITSTVYYQVNHMHAQFALTLGEVCGRRRDTIEEARTSWAIDYYVVVVGPRLGPSFNHKARDFFGDVSYQRLQGDDSGGIVGWEIGSG